MLLSFLTTAVLVGHLGAEAFGLFVIVSALSAYIGLLDFGIGPGLVKHFTEYSESGDADGVRTVMTLALAFYLALGLLFAPLAFLLAPPIAAFFTSSDALRGEAESAIVLMSFYFVASCIVGVFTARIVSLHRMDLTVAAALFAQAVHAALVLLIIPGSPTILTAVWLQLVQLALTGAISIAVVLRTDRRIYRNILTIPPALPRKLLAFGGWMQLNNISSLVNMEADKLIIGAFLTLETVTLYQIGNRLASLNRIIPLQLLSALMPAATIVQMRPHDRSAAAGFYSSASRYLMLLTLPITGFIAISAEPLVVMWMGVPYPGTTAIMLALGLSFALNNLTGAGTTMVRAAGQPRLEAYYGVLSLALNVGFTLLLAPRFGLAGVLAGTIIGSSLASLYFLLLFHRRFLISWRETVAHWLWPLVLATLAACAVVALLQSWIAAAGPHGRVQALALVSTYGVCYLAAFLAALTLLGFWTGRDLELARAAVRSIRGVRRSSP